MRLLSAAVAAIFALFSAAAPARADVPPPPKPSVQEVVYDLDTDYQAAVKSNDAEAMAKILADDFVLVTGRGATFNKSDLLKSAHDKDRIYEHQDESQKTVRLFGDRTAVVTALLWLKGTNAADKAPFDYKLWYSDVYVKRAGKWKYVFGQASLRLPDEKK